MFASLLKACTMATPTSPQNRSGRRAAGYGLGAGLALGISLGAAMHNVGLGLVLGVSLGLGFSGLIARRRRSQPASEPPPDRPNA